MNVTTLSSVIHPVKGLTFKSLCARGISGMLAVLVGLTSGAPHVMAATGAAAPFAVQASAGPQAGARVDAFVTRVVGGKRVTLPAAVVPALQPGDEVVVRYPDYSPPQTTVRYHVDVAFLTESAPQRWLYERSGPQDRLFAVTRGRAVAPATPRELRFTYGRGRARGIPIFFIVPEDAKTRGMDGVRDYVDAHPTDFMDMAESSNDAVDRYAWFSDFLSSLSEGSIDPVTGRERVLHGRRLASRRRRVRADHAQLDDVPDEHRGADAGAVLRRPRRRGGAGAGRDVSDPAARGVADLRSSRPSGIRVSADDAAARRAARHDAGRRAADGDEGADAAPAGRAFGRAVLHDRRPEGRSLTARGRQRHAGRRRLRAHRARADAAAPRPHVVVRARHRARRHAGRKAGVFDPARTALGRRADDPAREARREHRRCVLRRAARALRFRTDRTADP